MTESSPSSPSPVDPDEAVGSRRLHIFRDYGATMLEPQFRPIFASVVVVLIVGTLVFKWLEGWSTIGSLYFSVVTLATIGYGDLTPTTDLAKLFSIVYIFVGVGILGVFISAVSRASMQRTMERQEQNAARRAVKRELRQEHEL